MQKREKEQQVEYDEVMEAGEAAGQGAVGDEGRRWRNRRQQNMK